MKINTKSAKRTQQTAVIRLGGDRVRVIPFRERHRIKKTLHEELCWILGPSPSVERVLLDWKDVVWEHSEEF